MMEIFHLSKMLSTTEDSMKAVEALKSLNIKVINGQKKNKKNE